ncbi:MAG: adenylate/guanylate cyclase domain-containing protein [Balneolaceae bacterium]
MLQSKGNILLIHKNDGHFVELRAKLSAHFNVFTASDSKFAFQLLNEFDMHVIISSGHLGDMTAIQFFEGVAPSFPSLRTVLIASEKELAAARQAAVQGRIDYFLKQNAGFEEIYQVVRSLLKQAELLNDNQVLAGELKQAAEEQQRIMKLFKRYVPEQVVSQTLAVQDHEILQGETRIVSILFADIRKFTRIASSLNPEDVVAFLNDFWSALGEPVKMNHGSVNKLIGDGMLAIFGAPISHIHNQENAVNCALDMLQSLESVNEKYNAKFGTDIKVGIGINTGEVVVGNVGTNDYMEYTVIGDSVNIASRIESKTKDDPNSILISENTYLHVKDEFATEPSEPLIMDGKSAPINLYKVLGREKSNIVPIRRGNTY